MARDDNDRPYEDAQGRSRDPEMTGDVLSPRWSTEDTDEQPAIQADGPETYLSGPSGVSGLTGAATHGDAAPDAYATGRDVLGASHGLHNVRDVLDEPAGARDVLDEPGGTLPAGPVAPGGGTGTGASGEAGVTLGLDGAASGADGLAALTGLGTTTGADGFSIGGLGAATGPQEPAAGADGQGMADAAGDRSGEDDDLAYLPLYRGYEAQDGEKDDEKDGEQADEPRRGFLGSGWTDDADAPEPRRGERRRRGRVLLVAAAAVVLVGGAGWLLTGTSSDDPCAGRTCASAGEVTTPSEPPLTEEPVEDDSEPVVSDTPPATSETPAPSATVTRARPTRTPEARPTPTRTVRPTTRPTSGPATREPQGDLADTGTDGQEQQGQPQEQKASKEPEAQQPSSGPEQPPASQPAPTPSESQKGLFDILFPWA
ncbi:hypothetical protein AB0L05_34205 [Nonomuraea pusilla]|uniref:hypothetical protein n=1 Tax=Nonomuraea pusilla TaxID=46177 RepID=UPI003319723A